MTTIARAARRRKLREREYRLHRHLDNNNRLRQRLKGYRVVDKENNKA